MSTINSFKSVIRLWPKPNALATVMGEKPGTVRQWIARDSIPPEKFPAVVEAAAKWDFPQVTMALLKRLDSGRAGNDTPSAPSSDLAEFS